MKGSEISEESNAQTMPELPVSIQTEFETVLVADPNAWMYGELKEVVTEKQAQADILRWMNHKQFSLRKRKENAEWIGKLVAAVQDGDLIVNDDYRLVQQLRSTGGTLTFSERVPVKMFQDLLKSAKIEGEDGIGRINTMAALATGKTLAEMQALDGEDKDLKDAITLFFL
jgi:hypothetical protein